MMNTQKVYAMLGNENLWETARSCHGVLAKAGIPHSICGGVAVCLHGLPVLRLSKLIEVKLACGTGNLRRTHKDFADVVELVAIHGLDGSFARFLHRSVRKTFRELARRAQGDD